MNAFVVKCAVLVALATAGLTIDGWLTASERPQVVSAALEQLHGNGEEFTRQEQLRQLRSLRRMGLAALVALWGLALFVGDATAWLLRLEPPQDKTAGKVAPPAGKYGVRPFLLLIAAVSAISLFAGCWRPFEPIQLETISPNEEAFLLPLIDDVKRQTSTNNEEYLKENLVYTKQVRIPQQWVQRGYETFGPNGTWQPAAILVKVDKSPVTREWTADSDSGTSNKNEAIWVMTSDQVEFSTGWTCTARIASRDDAVKFLHNYPNGSLREVLDTEVRGKLQAVFGLEVTDQPMSELRSEATPFILRTVNDVTEFFKQRGVTITNLGITGGFVYKDRSIMDTMVRVFNAEQEKAIATAGFQAQEEKNKAVFAEAEGRAKALLTEKQAEAEGIKLVADAQVYEMDVAQCDPETYLALKRLDIDRARLEQWDGKFPSYFVAGGQSPDLLWQMPVAQAAK
jgi:regulator of protease activity HflC (stomatin/prohibitin superfamily)